MPLVLHPLRPVTIGAALACLLLLAGCVRWQDPGSPSGKIPLTFAYWALSQRETAVIDEVVAAFRAEHPDIDVSVLEIPNRYYEKLQMMFAAGTPPDVMIVNYGRTGDLARRGVLADLTPLMAGRDGLQPEEFLPVAYRHFRQIGDAVGRPGLYALPQDWNPTNLLLYDRDAFDAAGLPCPRAGWTWEDFANACRKLTVRSRDPGQRRYGAAVCLYPYAALAWFWQAGGEVLSADGRTSRLAAPENVQAVRFLKGLVEEGVVTRPVAGEDRSLEDFQSGRVAMAFVTPFSLGSLQEAGTRRRWGLAPPLVGTGAGTGCIPTGVAIAGSSLHPEAAWELVRHLVTRGAEARGRAGLAVPAWQPALTSAAFREGFGPEAAAALQESVALARPHPLSAALNYEEMTSVLRKALEDVFAAGRDPHDALRESQEALMKAPSP